MSALIVPDQTAILAAAGLTAPKVTDFVPGVPLSGLVEVWRRNAGVTLTGGKVSAWAGYNGLVAMQTDAAKRPTQNGSNEISFTGSGDVLVSTVTPATNGYVVMRWVPKTLGALAYMVGSITSTTAPIRQVKLGTNASNRFVAGIGDEFIVAGTGGVVSVDTPVTVGIYYPGDGTASLRVNGVQQGSTANYAASGAGVGTAPYWFGAANFNGNVNGEVNGLLRAVAFYNTVQTSDQLAAIDAAIALL